VFILDEQGRPVGVVSAADVLAALAWEERSEDGPR
jgi:CBS-domain-containing membrane protein